MLSLSALLVWLPAAAAASLDLIRLRAEGVEIAVVPRLAGRIAVFRATGGPNVLKWDPAHERARESEIPPLDPAAPWVAYNGHVVWTGPQRDWPGEWPPDPATEFAAFEVVRRSDRSAVLRGPVSARTGLRLVKTVEILEGGRVRVAVAAENASNREVAADLWSNTRLPGHWRAYAPAGPGSRLRLEHRSGEIGAHEPIGYSVAGGWLALDASPPSPGIVARVGKAFLHPDRGIAAAAGDGWLFMKRAPVVPPDRVHPDQAFIELYQDVRREPAASLLEVEMHGAYERLPPGGSMRFEETWALHRVPANAPPAAVVAALDRIVAAER